MPQPKYAKQLVAQSQPSEATQTGPRVPEKTPQLPQKPLAYRQSQVDGEEVAIKRGISTQLKSNTHGPETHCTSHPSVSLEGHDKGVGIAATSRICGLRRAQSQMLPVRAAPPLPLSSRPPHAAAQPFRMDQDRILRLAAVTATYIHTIALNRNLNVTGDEIRKWLENNISLAGLCGLLRAMGLEVDSTHLATMLRNAEPAINLDALGELRWDLGSSKRKENGQQPERLAAQHSMRYRPHTIAERPRVPDRPVVPVLQQTSGHTAQAEGDREVGLSGTHQWVEQRMRRMMSDNFLRHTIQ